MKKWINYFSIITQIYDTCNNNIFQKRIEDWLISIENRLVNLEIKVEDFGNNENFATSLFMLSQMILTSSDVDKKKYFANALINSAIIDIDETKLKHFLNLLNKYSVAHILLLNFYQSPVCKGCFGGSRFKLIEDAFPELAKNTYILESLIKDLTNDGLISVDVHCMVESMGSKWTSKLGDEFLHYISEK